MHLQWRGCRSLSRRGDPNEAAPPEPAPQWASGFRRAAGGGYGIQYPLASLLVCPGLGLFGTVSVFVTGRISHLQLSIKSSGCFVVLRGRYSLRTVMVQVYPA